MKRDHEHMDDDDLEPPRLAWFGERLTAFLLDGLLFWGLFALSLKLIYPGTGVLVNRHGPSWLGVWAVLLILYHAEAAAAGRPTFGKWLLGLRVLGDNDKPLPFPRALLRAVGYLPSSFLNIGFIWAAFQSESKTWHDLLAGSKVVTVKPRPEFAVHLATVASFVFLGVTVAWQQLGADTFYETAAIAESQHALKQLAKLEEVYHNQNGRYTENVQRLVKLTASPDNFYLALVSTIMPENGISIRIRPDGKHYIVMAFANDPKHTQIKFEGPLRS